MTLLRPRKLTAIVVCVGRAEHLKATMAHNAKCVDELVVVTKPDDAETMSVFTGIRRVALSTSERIHQGDAAFNKGAAINDALRAIGWYWETTNDCRDWILFTDADIFLPPNLHAFFHSRQWNPAALFGAGRTPIDADDARRIQGGAWPAEQPDEAIAAQPNGYFQLWHASKFRDKWPNVMSEAFCSAGGVDSWFCQQFDEVCRIRELYCCHIEHTQHYGDSWNGRHGIRPCWRQCGLFGRDSKYYATEDVPAGRVRYRLTETKDANQIECESADGTVPPELVCSNGAGGLIFNGRDVGLHHIHVAYWRA